LRARLENICGEWHLKVTATGKARIAPAIPVLIQRHPTFPATRKRGTKKQARQDKEHLMLDVVMLALGLGFFVVAVGYTYACERL
jgi:hypothetical protein